MRVGSFLEKFFSKAGELDEPNMQGEYAVHCPFEHDKGYEQNPSAHVNLEKGMFHCKTCRAEERFSNGGLSEVQFIQKYYGVTHRQALFIQNKLNEEEDADSWLQYESNLANSPALTEFIQKRGLTLETVQKYRLGYIGSGIAYPVFLFGEICDVRTYQADAKPKMRSRTGATTLVFPFDDWYVDDRPTLLVGGENDALIARQLGFNGVTFTGGEGAVPAPVLLKMFSGKKVYIMYDGDEAGIKGSNRVGFYLKDAGAEVYVIDIKQAGISGEKDDKDISDLVLKHGANTATIQRLIESAEVYTEKAYKDFKNKEFPLVDLWNATKGEYYGKRISCRVIMVGKYDQDMQVPGTVKFYNTDKEDPKLDEDVIWTLEESNLKDFTYLAELNQDMLIDTLYTKAGIYDRKGVGHKVLEWIDFQKVMLAPDVENNDAAVGGASAEQYAYVIGDRLMDGERYRIFFKPYAHPNNKHRVFLVVDRVESSDNAVNTFKVTPAMFEQLSVFKGEAAGAMERRFQMAKGITKDYTSDMLVWAADLAYHSPLRFQLMGKSYKGYPEIAVVGESRTGKTATAVALQKFYRIGNITSLKNASVAGLVGGAEKGTSGTWRIKWGTVPRNDGGLVILDEMSGAGQEVMSHLTDMRSQGEAVLNKIGGTFKAPARTRLLWVGNPRVIDGRSKSLLDYPTGIDAVLDLVGADEDVARFDAVMLVVDKGVYYRPDEFSNGSQPHDRDAYANLVRWAWSRKESQITFAEDVDNYLWMQAQVLNERYATDVKLFGAEAHIKLARFAVACAMCCFSTDEVGETVIVEKDHVDWAVYFMNRCYDNDVFRLKEYVNDRRKYNESNIEVNSMVQKLMNVESNEILIRELLRSNESIPRNNLQMISGLNADDFAKILSSMTKHYLVLNQARGIQATRRLRKAVRSCVDIRLKPLSER